MVQFIARFESASLPRVDAQATSMDTAKLASLASAPSALTELASGVNGFRKRCLPELASSARRGLARPV